MKQQSLVEQCKQLPGQMQKVCLNMAEQRYKKHYHPKNKHHKKHLIIDGFLASLVVLLSVASFYLVFFYQASLLNQGLHIHYSELPDMIESGRSLTFNVQVENHTDETFEEVALDFPEGLGFYLVNSTPSPAIGSKVILNEVKPGATASINVTGYVLSDLNDQLQLSSVLLLDRGVIGKHTIFYSEPISLSGSALDVSVDLPDTIIANQEFDFSIEYSNTSLVTGFNRLTLLPNWPPGWEVIESTPALETNVEYWVLDQLGSLEQGSITGKARLNGVDLKQVDLEIEGYIAPIGTPLLQTIYQTTKQVSYPHVTATLEADRLGARLGQTVTYQLSFTNNEVFALNNAEAHVRLSPALFVAPKQERLDENEYSFSVAGSLQPDETVYLDIPLSLRSSVNPALAFAGNNEVVDFQVDIVYTAEQDQQITYPVSVPMIPLSSDLRAQAFARYYSVEGDQIGRGPIPPIVGETTKYWVFVHLDNQIHPLSDVRVSGILPQGVNSTGRSSVTEGGGINFDSASGSFTWDVGTMPDYKTNFSKRNYGVAFEVAVTPSPGSIGNTITLANDIEVQAKDTVTGQILTLQLDRVTTNLEQDAYAGGDGLVTR